MSKKHKIICIGILIVLVVVLAYQVLVQKNYRMLFRGGFLIVIYILALFGIRGRSRASLSSFFIYEEMYRDVLQNAFSENHTAHNRLLVAVNDYNNGDYEKALTRLEKLKPHCKTSQDTYAVLYFQVQCLEKQKRFSDAIDVCSAMLQLNRSNAEAWLLLAMLYDESGDAPHAISAYRMTVQYDGGNANAYCNLAAIELKNGEVRNALDDALRALMLDENLVEAMGSVSIAYAMQGDFDNAEDYYRQYHAKHSDSAWLREWLDKKKKEHDNV